MSVFILFGPYLLCSTVANCRHCCVAFIEFGHVVNSCPRERGQLGHTYTGRSTNCDDNNWVPPAGAIDLAALWSRFTFIKRRLAEDHKSGREAAAVADIMDINRRNVVEARGQERGVRYLAVQKAAAAAAAGFAATVATVEPKLLHQIAGIQNVCVCCG